MAAADVLYEVMSIMVKKGPLSRMMDGKKEEELQKAYLTEVMFTQNRTMLYDSFSVDKNQNQPNIDEIHDSTYQVNIQSINHPQNLQSLVLTSKYPLKPAQLP